MGRYRRTVSFPNPLASTSRLAPPNSLHVRSASLPCARSSPLIPHLRDQINDLQSWLRPRPNNAPPHFGSGRACDGLARLKTILDSLDDVLQLPQTQDSLSSSTPLVERLLEDFLKFVDAYGIFHAAIFGLKQELLGAQVAIRRKDVSKLGLHIKAQKKIANEIGDLVSAVGSPAADQPPPVIFPVDDMEEVRRLIPAVHRLTASVSAGVFAGLSASFGPGRRPVWAGFGLGLGLSRRVRKEEEGIEGFHEVVESLMGLKKKGECELKGEEMRVKVLKRMHEMEDCIGEMEKGSERVFRSLISTRVSLLNILTHA